MSRLTKLLVLVISIISIVQSVWLLALVVPIDYVSKFVLPSVQTNTDWLLIAALTISVIVALIGVAAIITVLFAPKKADQLIFRSPSGRLSISKKRRLKNRWPKPSCNTPKWQMSKQMSNFTLETGLPELR
ncbi:hypothetical protein [Lentilactobacillus rapi]|uniref:hypothetical protein n=1 Tax=Lentilactobacillus rapi TaxID=481723 RepID=UPI0006CF9373|nr:hypothetical protein [Lentilactobacillus rapi]